MLRNHDVIIRALSYQATPLDSQAMVTVMRRIKKSKCKYPQGILDPARFLQLPLQLLVSRQIFNTLAPIVVGLERTVDDRCIELCTMADTFRFATRLVFDFCGLSKRNRDKSTSLDYSLASSLNFRIAVLRKPDVVQHLLCLWWQNDIDVYQLPRFVSVLKTLPHLESFTSPGSCYNCDSLLLLLEHPNEAIRTKSLLSIIKGNNLPASGRNFEEPFLFELVSLLESANNVGAITDYLRIAQYTLGYFGHTGIEPRARLLDLALNYSNDARLRNDAVDLLCYIVYQFTDGSWTRDNVWPHTQAGSLEAVINSMTQLLVASNNPDDALTAELVRTIQCGVRGLRRTASDEDRTPFCCSDQKAFLEQWFSHLFEFCLQRSEDIASRCESMLRALLGAQYHQRDVANAKILWRGTQILREWHRSCLVHTLRLRHRYGMADGQIRKLVFSRPPPQRVFVAVRCILAAATAYDLLVPACRMAMYSYAQPPRTYTEDEDGPEDEDEDDIGFNLALFDFVVGDGSDDYRACTASMTEHIERSIHQIVYELGDEFDESLAFWEPFRRRDEESVQNDCGGSNTDDAEEDCEENDDDEEYDDSN